MANLAHSYAQVLSDRGSETKFMDRLFSYMKIKGHLSLLPQILRLLSRMPKKGHAVVAVAKKSDADKYKNEITSTLKALNVSGSHQVVEDERIVGGYLVRTRSGVVDKSFRSALVSLYRSIARS